MYIHVESRVQAQVVVMYGETENVSTFLSTHKPHQQKEKGFNFSRYRCRRGKRGLWKFIEWTYCLGYIPIAREVVEGYNFLLLSSWLTHPCWVIFQDTIRLGDLYLYPLFRLRFNLYPLCKKIATVPTFCIHLKHMGLK